MNVQNDIFDSSHYASSPVQKLARSLQLAGRYFLWDVPRYWRQSRRMLGSGWDFEVLANPLREFDRRSYHRLPLPPKYSEALRLCYDANVRITMPEIRLRGLAAAWWATRDVPGDVMECGAYRGATSLFLATLGVLHASERRVYMLDTFEGMPGASKFDSARPKGEFEPPKGQVDRILRQATTLKVEGSIVVCAGLFARTFADLAQTRLDLSLAHIDANLYESTRDACEFCLPRLAIGGYSVFDDYNGVCDLGARLAIREAASRHSLSIHPLAHCSAWARR